MLTNITFAIQSIFSAYAILCLLTFFFSIKNSPDSAMIFFVTFVANGLVVLVLNIFKEKINKNIKYLTINFFLVWIILILISSIPLLAIYENVSLANVFFLSTSLATTTGFQISNILVLDENIAILWQSIVQYIGANYTILSFLLFFLLVSSKDSKSFFLSKKIIILFNMLFLLLLLLYTSALYVFNNNFIESFSLSSAILSSGGMINLNNSILNNSYSNNYLLSSLIFLMFVSLLFLPLFIFFKEPELFKKFYKRIYNRIRYLIVVLFVIFLLIGLLGKLSFIENIFLGVSFITTTGILPNSFENYLIVDYYSSFLLLFIILMIIGTFSGTSNGGLKIDKLSIVIIKTFEELSKFIYTHNLQNIEILRKGSNQKELNSLYALIALGAIMSFLSVLLHNLAGYSVKDAFILSIGALTNTGEGIKHLANLNYEDGKKIHFILNLLMICGRFENIGYLLIVTRILRKT